MFEPQVQITLACNLRCEYCYERKENRGVMSDDTLERILRQCVEVYRKNFRDQQPFLPIIWHGGEPLLAGVEFFRAIVRIEARYPDVSFDNRLQTNGALMTEDLARFFHESGFNLGFSLDGPERVHDRHRIKADGRTGSFAAVRKGMEIYRRVSGMSQLPVIAVVTRYTVERGAAEFYAFFREVGCLLKLQPYDITVHDLLRKDFRADDLKLVPSPEDYGRFAVELFDRWFTDDPARIQISEFANTIKLLLCPDVRLPSVLHKKRCSHDRVLFDPYGRVFFCDLWMNDARTALGDVRGGSLEAMMRDKHALWDKIVRTFRTDENSWACFGCKYATSCNGGCNTCLKYNYAVIRGMSLDDPRHVEEIQDLFRRVLPGRGDSNYSKAYALYRDHIREVLSREIPHGIPERRRVPA